MQVDVLSYRQRSIYNHKAGCNGDKLYQQELRNAMYDLTGNPLVKEVNMAPDGSLLVIYPAGHMPQGIRIPPIYPNKLAMIRRAIAVMDKRLSAP